MTGLNDKMATPDNESVRCEHDRAVASSRTRHAVNLTDQPRLETEGWKPDSPAGRAGRGLISPRQAFY